MTLRCFCRPSLLLYMGKFAQCGSANGCVSYKFIEYSFLVLHTVTYTPLRLRTQNDSHDFNECHVKHCFKHTSTVLNFLMISMNAMVKMPMPKLSDAMCATLKHKMPKLDETCSLVTHRKQTLDSHDFNECHVKHCFKHTSTVKLCHDFKECHGQDVNMFFPPIRWLLALYCLGCVALGVSMQTLYKLIFSSRMNLLRKLWLWLF